MRQFACEYCGAVIFEHRRDCHIRGLRCIIAQRRRDLVRNGYVPIPLSWHVPWAITGPCIVRRNRIVHRDWGVAHLVAARIDPHVTADVVSEALNATLEHVRMSSMHMHTAFKTVVLYHRFMRR